MSDAAHRAESINHIELDSMVSIHNICHMLLERLNIFVDKILSIHTNEQQVDNWTLMEAVFD